MFKRVSNWLVQALKRDSTARLGVEEEITLRQHDPFLQVNEPGMYKELNAQERSEKERLKQIVKEKLKINRHDNIYMAYIEDEHVGTFVYHRCPESKTAKFFTANIAAHWQRCGIATTVSTMMKNDLLEDGYSLVEAPGRMLSQAGKAFLENWRKNQ